jgi:hypothetical protein
METGPVVSERKHVERQTERNDLFVIFNILHFIQRKHDRNLTSQTRPYLMLSFMQRGAAFG